MCRKSGQVLHKRRCRDGKISLGKDIQHLLLLLLVFFFKLLGLELKALHLLDQHSGT
jgi:hypothetical protein